MDRAFVFVLYLIAVSSAAYAFEFIEKNSWLPMGILEFRIVGASIVLCQSFFILGQFNAVSGGIQSGFSIYCIGLIAWALNEVFIPEWAFYPAVFMLLLGFLNYWNNCSWQYHDPPGLHAAVAAFPVLLSWYLVIVQGCDKLPLNDKALEYCAVLAWFMLTFLLVMVLHDATSGLIGAFVALAVATTSKGHSFTALVTCVVLAAASSVQWCRPDPDRQPLLA